jgi:hypothetical protein
VVKALIKAKIAFIREDLKMTISMDKDNRIKKMATFTKGYFNMDIKHLEL